MLTRPNSVFEIPSNIILKRLKPHVWLTVCMFGFGLVTICQGLVQGYGGFIATRFFLGLFETGMFPGMRGKIRGADGGLTRSRCLLPDRNVVQAT